MKPTQLILVRHGETDWNAAGRIQGHLDIPLNGVGHRQAAALAGRFRTEPCDVIYSSDLARAAATAARVAEAQTRSVMHEVRLRERHLGVLQGLTRDEALVQQRVAWERFKRRQADEALEGGETLSGFSQRVQEFLVELGHRHRGERVLIVTHGGVLDAAYRLATALPLDAPRDFPLPNAAVNTLSHDGRQWRIEGWGDVSHLRENASQQTKAVDFIDYAGIAERET